MSMTKIECFIDYYEAHYEKELYDIHAYEYDVLEVLNDFSYFIDLLDEHMERVDGILCAEC